MNNDVWIDIQCGLEKIAAERYHRDIDLVKLLIAVIISAGKDNDLAYLGSDQFLYHCHLCGLNSIYVSELIEKASGEVDEVDY